MATADVFRQLRASPNTYAEHAGQLNLVRDLLSPGSQAGHSSLPRKAQARALLDWAVGRCAVSTPKDGTTPTVFPSILEHDFWSVFHDILTARDDSRAGQQARPSTSAATSTPAPRGPLLLSKADIRQAVLVSRGQVLFNTLRWLLESMPGKLINLPKMKGELSQANFIALSEQLHAVFALLLPLSLSSPNTALDGLLPCVHAFIRSSGQLVTRLRDPFATYIIDVGEKWAHLGQLLLSALTSLCKTTSLHPTQTTAADKALLKKISTSFLDRQNGFAEWKACAKAYDDVSKSVMLYESNGLNEIVKAFPETKGKSKLVYGSKGSKSASLQDELLSLNELDAPLLASSNAPTTTQHTNTSTKHMSLTQVIAGFVAIAIFSPANLARLLAAPSPSSTSTALENTKQAQEALKDLFDALKALSQTTSFNSPDADVSTLLLQLFRTYVDTLSTHSHEIFAPSAPSVRGQRASNNTAEEGASTSAAGGRGTSANSRSATEYHVQDCLRHAVFGFLQSSVQLLRSYGPSSAAASSETPKASTPRKRARESDASTSATASHQVLIAQSTVIKTLLLEVHARNIYIAGGAGGANRDWLNVLKSSASFLANDLLVPLSAGPGASQASATSATVHALATLAKLDFVGIEDSLSMILSSISSVLSVPNATHQADLEAACNAFVDATLAYNGKIRQLPKLLTLWTNVALKRVQAIGDNKAVIDSLFTGPLLSNDTRDKIERECSTSLGTTQFAPLVKQMLGLLQPLAATIRSSPQVAAENAEATPSKSKKQKKRASDIASNASPSKPSTTQDSAVTVAASWQTVALGQILECVIISSTASKIFPVQDSPDLASLAADIGLFTVLQEDLAGSQARQRLAAVMLGLQDAWLAFNEKEGGLESELANQLLQACADKNGSLLPTLRVAMIRTLLSYIASSAYDAESQAASVVFDCILKSCSPSLEARGADIDWDEYLHDIQDKTESVALWWLLCTSYLDILESHGSEAQLSSFVHVLFEAGTEEAASQGLNSTTFASVNAWLFRSADFFEYLRIKARIAAKLGDLCDCGDPPETAISIALLLPREYLDRQLKRKMVSSLAKQPDVLEHRKRIMCLSKCSADDAGTPLIQDFEMLKRIAQHHDQGEDFAQTHLYEQLVALMLLNWSSSVEKFTMLPDLFRLVDASTATQKLHLRTWRIICDNVKLVNVPDKIRSVLRSKLDALHNQANSMSDLKDQLVCYNTCQIASVWLSEAAASEIFTSAPYAATAKIVLSTLIGEQPSHHSAGTAFAALELASRNLSNAKAPKELTFEAFVVAFWLMKHKYDLKDKSYQALLGMAAITQEAVPFQEAINAILQLVDRQLSDQALAAALESLAVLVCKAPESGSKIATQAFSTALRRIALLRSVGENASAISPVVIAASLAFVKTVLEQRIGIPEVHDVALIWSILHNVCQQDSVPAKLGKPSSPIEALSSQIYMHVIEITAILATHRRDLVIPTFTHFSRVISDILLISRASAGIDSTNEQDRLQFPFWAIGNWLEADIHGKAIGRLLIGLGTRTNALQRSQSRSKQAQSTRRSTVISLSGPLSKQAPFILVNYLSAATDSRFAISSATRAAMNTGILEILGTMGKFEREALMKNFLRPDQEAERVLLRTMWKEFDANRYRGD